MLTLITLENVETVLLFSTSNFTTLINVEIRCEYDDFQKVEKNKKNIFELEEKDDSFDQQHLLFIVIN